MAQFDQLGGLINSYFMDESQLRNLMIFIQNQQVSPQTVQSYVEQMAPRLSAADPAMFSDRSARLMNALNGVNYNTTEEMVSAPPDQQDPGVQDVGQVDSGQDFAAGEGEITG